MPPSYMEDTEGNENLFTIPNDAEMTVGIQTFNVIHNCEFKDGSWLFISSPVH